MQAARTLRIVRTAQDPAPEPPDRLLTAGHVAERLSVCESTVYRMAIEGTLPAVRIGRLVRFSDSAVSAFIKRAGS